jgi:hypothetical protein
MLTATGSVLAFGAAHTHGTPGNGESSLVGIASSPSGNGYWIVRADGTISGFGDARDAGDAPHPPVTGLGVLAPTQPSTDVITAPGGGYWILDENGRVLPFGGAPKLGGVGNIAMFTP